MSPMQLELFQGGERRRGICLQWKSPLMLMKHTSLLLGHGDCGNTKIDGLVLGTGQAEVSSQGDDHLHP